MFIKTLVNKTLGSPVVLGVLVILLLLSGVAFAVTKNSLDDKKEELEELDSKYQQLLNDNEALALQIELNEENLSDSNDRVKKLKEELNNKPKESVVYVKEYTEKPVASECVMDDDWLSSYEKIRNSASASLSTN